jgi:hypothetical protein
MKSTTYLYKHNNIKLDMVMDMDMYIYAHVHEQEHELVHTWTSHGHVHENEHVHEHVHVYLYTHIHYQETIDRSEHGHDNSLSAITRLELRGSLLLMYLYINIVVTHFREITIADNSAKVALTLSK